MKLSYKRKNAGLCRVLSVATFLAGSIAFAASLSEPPANFESSPAGSFQWEGSKWSLASYDSNWHSVKQSALKSLSGESPAESSSIEDGKWSFRVSGSAPTVGSRGDRLWTIDEHLQRLGENTIGVHYHVSFPDEVEGESVALEVTIPVSSCAGKAVEIDGNLVTLPEVNTESAILFRGSVRTVVLPVSEGTLTFMFTGYVQLQDNRRWGGDTFSLRLHLNKAKPDESAPTSSAVNYALKMNTKFTPQ